MKTLLFALFAICVLNFSYSQTPIEKPQSDNHTKRNSIENSINKKYFSHVNDLNTSIKVTKLQKMAAKYEIKDSKIYNTKRNNTYDVVFEESNCKIEATYNNIGEIINSVENYKNVRLPLKLSKMISKKHPNWQFSSNMYSIIYTKNESVLKSYIIQIHNGNTRKELQFKMIENPQVNYVAIN